MVAFFQSFGQSLPTGGIQQIFAYAGHRHECTVQIDEHTIGVSTALGIESFAQAASIGFLYLAIGQCEMCYQILPEQLGACQCFKIICFDTCNLIGIVAAGEAEFFASYCQR